MKIQKGEKAPNFTLRATDKSEVSLGDFKSKNVVLLFFPLAFTGVCTDELCTVSYDALYEDFVLDMKGVSKRSAFIVDKEGIIQYAEVLESAGDLPNFTAIKETLKGLN